MNNQGRTAVIEFLKDEHRMIIDRIGGGSAEPIRAIIASLGQHVSRHKDLDEVCKFYVHLY